MICPLIYFSSSFTGILLSKLNRLLLSKFLIVDFVFEATILRGCSLPCKLFRKLFFVSIKVDMSEGCLVEHKRVCCLIFPRIVTLKVHSILYKEFLNEIFGECLSCVNSFVKTIVFLFPS